MPWRLDDGGESTEECSAFARRWAITPHDKWSGSWIPATWMPSSLVIILTFLNSMRALGSAS